MVDRSRELEAALGSEDKRVMENERETVVLQRRAIRVTRAIKAGECFTRNDLTVLRPCPAEALPPYRMDDIIGRRSTRDIDEGDCVLPNDFA